MTNFHHHADWQRLLRTLKPQLIAALPRPCPRCGKQMDKGQKLDLSHISRAPELRYQPTNLRLEHAHCNRAAGGKLTARTRFNTRDTQLPSW